MQDPSDFERAQQKTFVTRWAGDPERWGGTSKIKAVVTASTNQPHAGAQCLRAQTRELIATTWDFFVTWTLSGIVLADDSLDLFLDVTLGTGQSSSRALMRLSAKAAGAPPTQQNPPATAFGWEPVPSLQTGVYNGVAVTSAPVPAAAVAARPIITIKHAGGAADHPFQVLVNAHCCPRSWVP
jgi:hypothetical protein